MSASSSLGRRASAEELGTGFPVAVVVGSGIAAQPLPRRRLLVHVVDQLRQPRRDDRRTLSDTFAGVAPASAPGFIAAQLGAGLAVALARIVFPEPEPSLEEALDARP